MIPHDSIFSRVPTRIREVEAEGTEEIVALLLADVVVGSRSSKSVFGSSPAPTGFGVSVQPDRRNATMGTAKQQTRFTERTL